MAGVNTLITPTFAALPSPNGTWTLRFRDGGQGDTGSVSAATLTIATAAPTPRILSVTKAGAGTGVVTGGGIDCGLDCSEPYADGLSVVLTAAPDVGSSFESWSGCTAVIGPQCTVSMTADKTATANFAKSATGESPKGLRADAIAPNTAIGKHPQRKATKRRAKFTFSSTETGSSFKCKLDKGAFKPCVSPFKKKVGIGKHTFKVVATDTAGNTDTTPAKFRFEVKPEA
ncbi:MAG TPA: hypothetical protein VGO66_04760 [Solirubrobacterales bacterium]|nr:hypothetical protein [Solirubrobacterales bacterium]